MPPTHPTPFSGHLANQARAIWSSSSNNRGTPFKASTGVIIAVALIFGLGAIGAILLRTCAHGRANAAHRQHALQLHQRPVVNRPMLQSQLSASASPPIYPPPPAYVPGSYGQGYLSDSNTNTFDVVRHETHAAHVLSHHHDHNK